MVQLRNPDLPRLGLDSPTVSFAIQNEFYVNAIILIKQKKKFLVTLKIICHTIL